VLDALGIRVLVTKDRTEEYRISGRLPDAEKTLREEILARQKVFGAQNLSLAKLISELVMVLKAQHRLSEADMRQREVVGILTNFFGDRHPSSLLAKVTLASILSDQGLLKDAEMLQRLVQPVLNDVLGPEHPDTITALQILATNLASQGKYKEAEQTLRAVVTSRDKVMAAMHPQTIRATMSLASVLRAQGMLSEASSLMDSIDEKIRNVLNDDKFTKANLFIGQTHLYKDLGLLSKATESAVAALETIENLNLPEDDELRLIALESMALIHGALWNLKEQEEILRRVLRAKSSLDRRNPWLLETKSLLAKNLLDQALLDEASAMAEDVLIALGSSVTFNTKNILACTDILATVLFFQGQRGEAEEVRRQLLSSCEMELGKTDSFTLAAAYSLGEFYSEQGAYDIAQTLYIPVLQRFRDLQQFGLEAIKVATLLAISYRQQGNFDEAVKICTEAIVWSTQAFGEDHIETLAVYDILGRTYLQKGATSDAEELYLTRLEKQSKGHKLEISVRNNMAELMRQQGQFDAAEELTRVALQLSVTRHGKMHPESINMAGQVVSAALNRDLTDQLEESALETIELKVKVFGITHPSTINTLSALAYAYAAHGRFADARVLYNRIEDSGGVRALENSNPDRFATFCGKLADLYFRESHFEQAQKLEEKSLAVRQRIYDSGHRATLVSMANLASTLSAQRKYEEAELYLRQIVTVHETTAATDPQSIFNLQKSKVSLAAVLFFQDKLVESADLYRAVLEAPQRIGISTAVLDIWRADFQKVLKKLPEQEFKNS